MIMSKKVYIIHPTQQVRSWGLNENEFQNESVFVNLARNLIITISFALLPVYVNSANSLSTPNDVLKYWCIQLIISSESCGSNAEAQRSHFAIEDSWTPTRRCRRSRSRSGWPDSGEIRIRCLAKYCLHFSKTRLHLSRVFSWKVFEWSRLCFLIGRSENTLWQLGPIWLVSIQFLYYTQIYTRFSCLEEYKPGKLETRGLSYKHFTA